MSDSTPVVIELPAERAIAIRATLPMRELPAFFERAFTELAACAGARSTGTPFAIYHAITADTVDAEAALPVTFDVTPIGAIHVLELAGGPAVEVRHAGPYADLGTAYMAIERWLLAHHRARGAPIREIYLTDPSVAPDELVTLVRQPLAPG